MLNVIKMKCVCFLLVAVVFSASAQNCSVIPMSEWAGEASHRVEAISNPLGLVVMQHTVTPEGHTNDECERLVQAIRKYQMKDLSFDDIGSSFLVCRTGRVYEGAGWTLVGAHTRNYNHKAFGVTFIGNFGSKLPTPEAIKAAQDLLACGVKNGHLSKDYKIVGHRQVANTQSPGDELQKEIEKWPQWTSQPN